MFLFVFGVCGRVSYIRIMNNLCLDLGVEGKEISSETEQHCYMYLMIPSSSDMLAPSQWASAHNCGPLSVIFIFRLGAIRSTVL